MLIAGNWVQGTPLKNTAAAVIWAGSCLAILWLGLSERAKYFGKNGMIVASPRRACRNLATAVWAALAVFALFQGGFARENARAQGSSEMSKTTPSTSAAPPAAAPAAPAPPAAVPAAPAPAAVAPQVHAGPQSNPIGAGAAWETKTQPAAAGPSVTDAGSVALVQQINIYFNKMSDLQGNFVQTDPDNKEKKGKFYFSRPGKIRFDYGSPSRQKIISDGKYLAVEDRDLNTSDRYPLDSTPFRLLLLPNVDFLRDANIISIDQGAEAVILTVEDKASDTAGRIRLFFSHPNLALKEWIITDPQGQNTRVELRDVELNKSLSADLFKFSEFEMPNLR
jgi:outer membrane lipoprotein-sorting protein